MPDEERFEIASIQPVGSGTEVRAERATVDELVAFHCGYVRSAGVPVDLVRRFLGKTFTRQELEAQRARILDDRRVVVTWLGQAFFLAPARRQSNGYANGHVNGYANGHVNGYANGHLNGHGGPPHQEIRLP